MLRFLILVGGLALAFIGLSLNWVSIPENSISATGFETLSLASAFLIVLALGVLMIFYFKPLAQRILASLLGLITVYLIFISANSLLNFEPILDRLLSVTGAIGTSPTVSFQSANISVYFIGLGVYAFGNVFVLVKPRQTKSGKRISSKNDGDDPIGIWDSQS